VSPIRVDAARIRKCVEKLSADDFKIRESASAELKQLGPKAWPALEPFLKSEDHELTARLRMIAADFGILLDEQRELAAALIKKLESDQSKERIQGFDGLLLLGPAGIKLLQENLSGAGAEPRVTVDVPPSVVTNTEVKYKLSLSNESDKPFWVNERSRSLGYSARFEKPFGEPREETTTGSGGGGRSMYVSGGSSHPISRFAAITKSSKPLEHTLSRAIGQVGIYKINISQSVPNDAKISAKLPGSDNAVELLIGNELKETRKKPSQDFKLFVLPDFSRCRKARSRCSSSPLAIARP
jgi:hypothetical protein